MQQRTSLTMIALVLMISAAWGQLDENQPDYEYQNGQFLDDENDVLPKEYIPVLSPQEQKFLEGLIVEAGRHILFPKFYATKEEAEEDKDNTKSMKFYEMRGQPEMEQSYMNQKSRRGRMDCPEHCPFYKPVCGSDGKVYESDCHLQKENCGSTSVTIGPWQKCRGKHYLCPSSCLDLNDPVCGSDGRIYHNQCVLRKRNCGKIVEALPVRKCYENIRQSKLEDCPTICEEFYKPVCGSDGVIYYNECFLRKRTCRQGIVETDMEECIKTPRCPGICLRIKDPVCGSDGRLYLNECRMRQHNCGKEIKAVSRSLCATEEESALG